MKKATRQFWFGIFGWSVVALFMVIVAVQAISNIRSGNLAGGYRYDWQPLSPGIQLTALAFMLIAIAVSVWQHFRGRDKNSTQCVWPVLVSVWQHFRGRDK